MTKEEDDFKARFNSINKNTQIVLVAFVVLIFVIIIFDAIGLGIMSAAMIPLIFLMFIFLWASKLQNASCPYCNKTLPFGYMRGPGVGPFNSKLRGFTSLPTDYNCPYCKKKLLTKEDVPNRAKEELIEGTQFLLR